MKYPRTLHFPFSPGAKSDDKIADSVDLFLGKDVVITEKLDGSNCCLTKENVFARSHATPARHASFNWIKQRHAEISYLIKEKEMVFGENCYALHSIEYQSLPSYFFMFGVRENNIWASWEDVVKRANELNFMTAPELGRYNFKTLKELRQAVEILCSQPSIYGGSREGVVMRTMEGFPEEGFESSVIKWVREDHVQTDEHWSHQVIKPQKLSK